jgi:pyrimidine operon attenuation protein/uracil phosphoribosyltransferase
MNLPDPEKLYAKLRDTIALACTDRSGIGLIGIYSGGAWIAERLHKDLGFTLPCGFLDSALYRDDFPARGLKDAPKLADVPFDVDGTPILLVDDVLYTGRTIRAIVNHLFDYGRPARVDLAVLLDRGGRELPVEAQYLGERAVLEPHQSFVLTRNAAGQFHLDLEEGSA